MTANRSAIGYAFEEGVNHLGERAQLDKAASDSLLNQEGQTLHAIDGIHDSLRSSIGRINVLLPVYNQEKTIGPTLDYLTKDLGIATGAITVVSGSTDKSDEIVRRYDVDLVRQEQALADYLTDEARFLELMKAGSMKELRGKGLTMFAGHLHRYAMGRAKPHEFIAQVDTDIENIGSTGDRWDPITYFAWALHNYPELETIKAAKNGRNNQAIHILLNTLALFGETGKHYQTKIGIERWPLTGEYGWKEDVSSRLRWATGYAVEMILNMSQADLELVRRQVEIPEQRRDGQNLLTKETVMYSDIARVVTSVAQSGKRLNSLTLSEIGAINTGIQGHVTLVMDEIDSNPGPTANPNQAHIVQASRIIPDFETLQKEGFLYSGK